jgi:hypothetical protein
MPSAQYNPTGFTQTYGTANFGDGNMWASMSKGEYGNEDWTRLTPESIYDYNLDPGLMKSIGAEQVRQVGDKSLSGFNFNPQTGYTSDPGTRQSIYNKMHGVTNDFAPVGGTFQQSSPGTAKPPTPKGGGKNGAFNQMAPKAPTVNGAAKAAMKPPPVPKPPAVGAPGAGAPGAPGGGQKKGIWNQMFNSQAGG